MYVHGVANPRIEDGCGTGTSSNDESNVFGQLVSSMTACLVVNVLLSAAIGHPGNLSHPGLVSFGQVGVRRYSANYC